uniref:Apoptosis regulatory protein Siva n=1 Tax=Pogona vitticeps TaxID=103695 RepID=A0A6J0VE50_9SAUR
MPKRSYPFGDVAPLQLKTRVRLRELSQGVMGERYRQEIFEKTKQLLFQGAQAYMESACVGSKGKESLTAQYPEPLADRLQGCSRPRSSGQMLIGQDGKLQQPSPSETVLAVRVSKACSSCVRTVDVKEACAQCDRYICPDCSKLCSCCNSITCSLCSITESDDVGEHVLCSDCLAFKD